MADTDLFRAVSDPTRRAILDRLIDGDASASDLATPFAMSQPAFSQHLRVLRQAGLVAVRRDGRRRMYALRPASLRRIYDWVGRYERFWDTAFDRLGAYLDAEEADGSPDGSTSRTEASPRPSDHPTYDDNPEHDHEA